MRQQRLRRGKLDAGRGFEWPYRSVITFLPSGGAEAMDVDEEICWLSPVLNMTGTASFSMDLTWLSFDDYNLSADGSKDYIDVSYRIDGGSWVTLPNAVGGGPRTISYIGSGENNGSISGLGRLGPYWLHPANPGMCGCECRC
jgi:hypothetical protein